MIASNTASRMLLPEDWSMPVAKHACWVELGYEQYGFQAFCFPPLYRPQSWLAVLYIKLYFPQEMVPTYTEAAEYFQQTKQNGALC